MVEFILREYPDKPDELFIRDGDVERRADKADTKKHLEAYRALKAKMAKEPPRKSFAERRRVRR